MIRYLMLLMGVVTLLALLALMAYSTSETLKRQPATTMGTISPAPAGGQPSTQALTPTAKPISLTPRVTQLLPHRESTTKTPEADTLKADGTKMDEEKVVTGLVIANHLGCRVDGQCYLRLRVVDEEIRVVYDYGEWPPCMNQEAGDQGMEIKAGDEVQVFGKYMESGGIKTISTCDSLRYYIRKR